ncbi:MAG: peptidoglycan DD-metalloendopeptidase family protein [Erysipelotrichaceae bacterium]|nr:peptidoglycan DD-metalloendopeptidase family protein [Erysipelotrichaceae bacterium]
MNKITKILIAFILAGAIVFGLPYIYHQVLGQVDLGEENSAVDQKVVSRQDDIHMVTKMYQAGKYIGVVTDPAYLETFIDDYLDQRYPEYKDYESSYYEGIYLIKEKTNAVYENKDYEIFEYLRDNGLLAIKGYKVAFSDNVGTYATIYVKSEEDFDNALNEFLSNFISPESLRLITSGEKTPELQDYGTRDVSLNIMEKIEISSCFARPEDILDSQEKVLEYLCYGDNEEREYYTVLEGQTLEGVSFYNENMTPERLVMLNKDKLSSPTQILEPGMELNVTYFTSPITVYVTRENLREEIIYPENTIYIEDDTMSYGTEVIEVEEVLGVKSVLYNEVYINGVLQTPLTTMVSSNVVTEPIQGVIRTGSRNMTGIGSGIFRYPVDNWRVSCHWACYTSSRGIHMGTDFIDVYNPYGNCYAADNGIVISKGYDDISGYYVMIDHQNGYQTLYAHFNVPAFVEQGDVVYKGEVIGQIGMTGMATGPHVHFEIRINGTKIDACTIMGC